MFTLSDMPAQQDAKSPPHCHRLLRRRRLSNRPCRSQCRNSHWHCGHQYSRHQRHRRSQHPRHLRRHRQNIHSLNTSPECHGGRHVKLATTYRRQEQVTRDEMAAHELRAAHTRWICCRWLPRRWHHALTCIKACCSAGC